jgi:mono/diheme cytochrome c family protein
MPAPTRAWRWALLMAGWGCAASALALGGQNMVLGRMVQPRSDAPTVSPTTHVRARWVLHCAGCHGVDGAGSALGRVPDLRGIGAFLRVDGGRAFVIKVPGVMGSGLDDAQVAEVTNWLLATVARDSVPDGHRPFDAAEVTQARARPLVDVAAERQRLLDRARMQGLSLY